MRERVGLEPDVVPQRDRGRLRTGSCAGAGVPHAGRRGELLEVLAEHVRQPRACASYAAASVQVARGCSISSGTPGTESGISSPKTGSVAVGTPSSAPETAARTMARVCESGMRRPTPRGRRSNPCSRSRCGRHAARSSRPAWWHTRWRRVAERARRSMWRTWRWARSRRSRCPRLWRCNPRGNGTSPERATGGRRGHDANASQVRNDD